MTTPALAKIIQIATAPETESATGGLYALTDAGDIWACFDNAWHLVPPPPAITAEQRAQLLAEAAAQERRNRAAAAALERSNRERAEQESSHWENDRGR
jgi:hypothetical protein